MKEHSSPKSHHPSSKDTVHWLMLYRNSDTHHWKNDACVILSSLDHVRSKYFPYMQHKLFIQSLLTTVLIYTNSPLKAILLQLNTSDFSMTQDITKKTVFSALPLLHLTLLTSTNAICSTYAIFLCYFWCYFLCVFLARLHNLATKHRNLFRKEMVFVNLTLLILGYFRPV